MNRGGIVVAIAIVVWPLVVLAPLPEDSFIRLGGFASAVLCGLFIFDAAALAKRSDEIGSRTGLLRAVMRAWTTDAGARGSLRVSYAVGIGIATGALIILATRLAATVLDSWTPGFAEEMAGVYSAYGMTTAGWQLPLALAIVAAEEVLWRMKLPELLTRTRLSRGSAVAIAVGHYAAAQIGMGSPAVVAAGLCLGTVWALQREISGSLWMSLTSHAIWTSWILLVPVGT